MPDALICVDCAYHERFLDVPTWESSEPFPGRPTGGLQSTQRRLRSDMPAGADRALDRGVLSAGLLYRFANGDDVCDWCDRRIQLVRNGEAIVVEWWDDDEDDEDDEPFAPVPVVVLPISHDACAQCEDCEAQLDFGTDPCPHCGGSVRQVEAWTSGTEPPPEPEPGELGTSVAGRTTQATLDGLLQEALDSVRSGYSTGMLRRVPPGGVRYRAYGGFAVAELDDRHAFNSADVDITF